MRRSEQAVLIDIGCLFNLLLLRYVREAGVSEPRRTEILASGTNGLFDRIPEAEQLYVNFVQKWREFRTTAHVVAELNRHVMRCLHEAERMTFWKIATNYLREKNLEEPSLTYLGLQETSPFADAIPRFGVTDVGLKHLAFESGLTILTEDRALNKTVSDVIVPCIIVSERIWEDAA